jgi:hypothetical protein
MSREPNDEGPGGTLPTAERVATARPVTDLLVRVCVPDAACQWCLKAWPYPDARWSQRVLTRKRADV